MKYFAMLQILAPLARNFESTKIPREPDVAAYGNCLAHPRPSHTPSQERASISRVVVACKELYLSAREVQAMSWGYFLSICVPKIQPISTTQSPQKSRYRPLLKKRGRPSWRESQVAVDETLSWYTRALIRYQPAEGQNAACWHSDWIFYSDKTSRDESYPYTRGLGVDKILRGLKFQTY